MTLALAVSRSKATSFERTGRTLSDESYLKIGYET